MDGDFVTMTVSGVVVDPDSKSPTVVLKDEEGHFLLPIWVGVMEAGAITAALEGIQSPRPLTHDLLAEVIRKLGGKLEGVCVTDRQDDAFLARLELVSQGPDGPVRHQIDCRPSDALALALREDVPIFVRQEVVAACSIVVQTAGLGVGAVGTGSLEELLASLPDEMFGKYEM